MAELAKPGGGRVARNIHKFATRDSALRAALTRLRKLSHPPTSREKDELASAPTLLPCEEAPNCAPVFWQRIFGGDAFLLALSATAKVFFIGLAGYVLVARGVLKSEALAAFSSLVANLTLPCLILQRFSQGFDPHVFPLWWVLVVAGAALQVLQIALGWVLSRRLSQEQGRGEMVMLLGFQNSGFFVLPMLQGLLPSPEFGRAAVFCFLFIIFFNASFWPVGTRVLLGERGFDWKRALLAPPTIVTIVALVFFGIFHDFSHGFSHTFTWQVIFGGQSSGVLGLLGDLTTPLATLVLGGTVGQTAARGWAGFSNKGVALEVCFWKLVAFPLVGLALIHFFPVLFADRSLRLMIMLQFAAPVAMNVPIFFQQYGLPMRLTPAVCLACYALCLLSVPLWVALVL